MLSLWWETFIAFWLRARKQEAYTRLLRIASRQTMARLRIFTLVKTNPFLFLEGELEFQVGDEKITARPGTFIQGPRGIAHSFRNNTQVPARVLVFVTPAGFENFVKEFAQPVESFDSPAIPAGKHEVDKLLAAGPKYGLQILSPNK
jgi:Cupin domain